jgi:hypothetical protein
MSRPGDGGSVRSIADIRLADLETVQCPLSANLSRKLDAENIPPECLLLSRFSPLRNVSDLDSVGTSALEQLRDIDINDVNAIRYGEVRPRAEVSRGAETAYPLETRTRFQPARQGPRRC